MSESTDTTADAENTQNQDGNTPSDKTSGAGSEFKAPASQDELNKLIGERVERERKKYADYDDLKTKASEFDKLADANKSEIEKANEKASKAEAELTAIPTKVADGLKQHLVKLHEISDDDARLFLTATDPEVLLEQVSRLLDRSAEGEAERKRRGNRVPGEGTTTTTTPDEETAFAREFFGG